MVTKPAARDLKGAVGNRKASVRAKAMMAVERTTFMVRAWEWKMQHVGLKTADDREKGLCALCFGCWGKGTGRVSMA